MRDVLEQLLQAIFQANDLSDEASQVRYLQSLRPVAKQLWRTYRQQGGFGEATEYANAAVQSVYLVRYFIPYTQPIAEVLKSPNFLEMISLDRRQVRAVYFGAGPAPEVLGTLQHLKNHAPNARIPIAHLFDIADDAWAHARAINFNSLLPIFWDREAP